MLGLELIPWYRESTHRWREVHHTIDLAVGCHYFPPGLRLHAQLHQMVPPIYGNIHPIPIHYSFIDPERMKGWVSLVGWPLADNLPTVVAIHQLHVEHRTVKVRWSEISWVQLVKWNWFITSMLAFALSDDRGCIYIARQYRLCSKKPKFHGNSFLVASSQQILWGCRKHVTRKSGVLDEVAVRMLATFRLSQHVKMVWRVTDMSATSHAYRTHTSS